MGLFSNSNRSRETFNVVLENCSRIINDSTRIIDNTKNKDTAISRFDVLRDNLERIFKSKPKGLEIELKIGGKVFKESDDIYKIMELKDEWLKEHDQTRIDYSNKIYQEALKKWIEKYNEAISDNVISDSEFIELENLQENLGLAESDVQEYVKKYRSNDLVKDNSNALIDSRELDTFFSANWQMQVLFGKSSSSVYDLVISSVSVYPSYKRYSGPNGEEINDIRFGPEDILIFSELWPRIKNWKSTIVKINDQVIDHKILNKMLLCYKDKLRFKDSNPLFCYGASPFTFNLFGCHRTMLRDGVIASQKCWFNIGIFDQKGIFHVDKKAIIALLKKNVSIFYICPSLQLKNLKRGLDLIPDTIDPRNNKEWTVQLDYNGEKHLIPTIHYNEYKGGSFYEEVGDKRVQIEMTFAMADYYTSISPQFKKLLEKLIP